MFKIVQKWWSEKCHFVFNVCYDDQGCFSSDFDIENYYFLNSKLKMISIELKRPIESVHFVL
jgi:hypothetical protein